MFSTISDFKVKLYPFLFFSCYFFFFLFDNLWLGTAPYHGYYIKIVWILLSLLFSLPFFFWSLAFYKLEKNVKNSVILSLSWCILEKLRLYFLCGYPFSTVGSFFSEFKCFHPVIRLFGVYGVSFLVIFFFISLLSKSNKRIFCSFVILIVINLLDLGLIKQTSSNKTLSFLIVQPNHTVEQKYWVPELASSFLYPEEQLRDILVSIKNQFLPCDYIVLPEGALIGFLDQDIIESSLFLKLMKGYFGFSEEINNPKLTQREVFFALARCLNTSIIFGANRIDSSGHVYNSLVIVDPSERVSYYDKRILLPMGEYLPFEFLRELSKKYGVGGFYDRGNDPFILHNDHMIAASVCYEDCFPLLGSTILKNQPDFLVNITNDGWFYPSELPGKHARLAKLRALEYGVPLIRSCENDYSGVFTPDGRQSVLESCQKGGFFKVQLDKYKTIYPIIGEVWIVVLLILVILFDGCRKVFDFTLLKKILLFKFF